MLKLGSLVAYKERIAPDPMSGAQGMLRDEWRVRLVTDFDPADLTDAWGLDWRRYSPFAGFVLEHRYIRRGVEEPWTPFQSTNEYAQAFGYIPDKAVFLCPVFQELERGRLAELAQAREEAEEKARKDEEAQQARKDREASKAAFERMWDSPKFTQWAHAWNAFIQRHATDAERISANAEVMSAYQAVIAAKTVPTKARAVKEFLKIVKTIGLE